MTTLGGLSLSTSLVLLGLDDAPGLAWSSRRTLGGRAVSQYLPISGGRQLSLQSEYHLTHANVLALTAMEAAALPVTLVHARATLTVLITGLDLTPDDLLANPISSTVLWYSGTINLLEI